LLILLVLAYWPVRTDGLRAGRAQAGGARTTRGLAAGRPVT
jgi:hypothetical protein